MLIEILTLFILLLFFSVGSFIIMGLVIELFHKLIAYLLGYPANNKAILLTSILGTPIHELGHVIFCILFGHKITDMKLLILKPVDGTLGYVNHSFNKKNIYHRIGNLFIGIGPIISCSFAVWLIIILFSNNNLMTSGLNLSSFNNVIDNFFLIFDEIFNFNNHFLIILLQVFLISSISIHARLSFSDIKGSLDGLKFFSAFLFIIVILLYFIFQDIIFDIVNYSTIYFAYLLNIFIVIILGALIFVVFSAIWFLIRKTILKQ